MKTKINRIHQGFRSPPMALRASFIAVAVTAFLVPAMPLSAASADDSLKASSRPQATTGSAGAQEAATPPQLDVLDASGRPVCAELGKVEQLPAPATGINGEFTGAVGCGISGVYAEAAPGAGSQGPDVDVLTEVVWHQDWRAGYAYVDQAASPGQFRIAARAR